MSDAMIPFELENEEGLRLRGLDFGATSPPSPCRWRAGAAKCCWAAPMRPYPLSRCGWGQWRGAANRIGGAELLRDGQRWPLDANQSPHCLHGGRAGFHRQHWQLKEREADRVRLTLLSGRGSGLSRQPAGHAGVPAGAVRSGGGLRRQHGCRHPGQPHQPTYFNLDDNPDGSDVRDHLIRLNADRFLPTDRAGCRSRSHRWRVVRSAP